MGNSATFTSPLVSAASTGVAVGRNIFNEFDEMGLLVGEPRLIGEKNASYKRRLFRVFSERANSTYRGLINGITRGLGFEFYNAIQINFNETGNIFDAPNPAVVINESFVYLYSDVDSGTLDKKIDRFDQTGSAFTLTDLVAEINSSTYFTASVSSGADAYSRSMCILNQKSHVQVVSETVPESKNFALANKNIVKGTLFFSDHNRFFTEVASEGAVNAAGKYFVDYKKGIVFTFAGTVPGTVARYEYLSVPMVCVASPVIIHNMQDQDFKVKMFEQVLADDNTFVNGLPTALGSDIINELLTVFPGYWGK